MPLHKVIFLLATVFAFVKSQETVELTPVEICRWAPCHARYIENGVKTVIQRAFLGPDQTGAVDCCTYGSFIGDCCYDTFTLNLVPGSSRFSCPLIGVQKSADSCDKVDVSTVSVEPVSTRSKTPIPTAPSKQDCGDLKDIFKSACYATGEATSIAGTICPTKLDLKNPTSLKKQLDLVDSLFQGISGSMSSKDQWKTIGEFSFKALITKIAPNLLSGLITESVSLSVILAAPAFTLAAPLYALACGTVTAISIAASVCKLAVKGYESVNNCVAVDLDTRSYTELSNSLAARSGTLSERSDNPCTDWLVYFPISLQCAALTVPRQCTQTTQDYMNLGLSLEDSTALVDNCNNLAEIEDKLIAICNFQKFVVDFEPSCGPLVNTSSTASLPFPSSVSTFYPSNVSTIYSTPALASTVPGSWPTYVSPDQPSSPRTDLPYDPECSDTPPSESWPKYDAPDGPSSSDTDIPEDCDCSNTPPSESQPKYATPGTPPSSNPDLPKDSDYSNTPIYGTPRGDVSLAVPTAVPTYLTTNGGQATFPKTEFRLWALGLFLSFLLFLATL